MLFNIFRINLKLPRVKGERYFTCQAKYGVFVRPDKVHTGNFPVEEIDFDEEM